MKRFILLSVILISVAWQSACLPELSLSNPFPPQGVDIVEHNAQGVFRIWKKQSHWA